MTHLLMNTTLAMIATHGGPTPGQERLRAISESFVDDRFNASSSIMLTLVGLAIIIAVTTAGTLWRLRDVRRFGPQYRALASALELRWWEAHLLQRIARGLGLVNACGLLLSQGTFDRLTETYLQSRKEHDRRHDVVADIRGRLFSGVDSAVARS